MEKRRIAIIRIHGKKGLRKEVKDAFKFLRLYRKHTCVIVSNSDSYVGMLKKIDSFVAWGEINDETLRILLERRGRLARKEILRERYVHEKLDISLKEFVTEVLAFKKELKDLPGLKLFFKLSPPRGGFEKGGIKEQYAAGGASGYRKEHVNELIMRMV